MNYPLISEYIESVKLAEDNFDELSYLRPVLDAEGLPVMSSGNFAVVFKMKDERDGKLYAVRCFHRDQEGRAESYRLIEEELRDVESPYLVSFRYMDKELFVDSSQTDETEFPVLLMDWVEGITLDKYLRENLDDQYALEMLAYRFSQLAQWLIPQPFAHGDLKPDNILVREDGTLVLVDYDGMYVPAMKGQKARELGSPDFRHPLRTEDDFDEHIDDFPLVSILLSLKAISINPKWLEEYGTSNHLLFSEKDYCNIQQCKLLKELFPSDVSELNVLVSLFMFAFDKMTLNGISISLLNQQSPKDYDDENLSLEVTKEDLENAWCDEFGAIYSRDRKRLLKCPIIKAYSIKEGTKVIADRAFKGCTEIQDVIIPASVKLIGAQAFDSCRNLERIAIPHSVKLIGEGCFDSCSSLQEIKIPEGITKIEDRTFEGCYKLHKILLPDSLLEIGSYAFSICSISELELPKHLTTIGYHAFWKASITKLVVPNSVNRIDAGAFWNCSSLESITLPPSISEIKEETFFFCTKLGLIKLPKSVKRIGRSAFDGAKSLKKVIVPEGVTRIEYAAFSTCSSLEEISLPNSVTYVGDKVFIDCPKLKKICVPTGAKEIFAKLIPNYMNKVYEK